MAICLGIPIFKHPNIIAVLYSLYIPLSSYYKFPSITDYIPIVGFITSAYHIFRRIQIAMFAYISHIHPYSHSTPWNTNHSELEYLWTFLIPSISGCFFCKSMGSADHPFFTFFYGCEKHHQFIWVVYDIALPTFDMSDGLASRSGHFHREHSDRRNGFVFVGHILYSDKFIHPCFLGLKG